MRIAGSSRSGRGLVEAVGGDGPGFATFIYTNTL